MKRDFSDEYIAFRKKDILKRSIGIAVALPVLELVSGLIIYLAFGSLSTFEHLLYVLAVLFVLILPFPVIDSIKTNRKLRELAYGTESDIYIELNYKLLHKLFRPGMDLY